MDTMELLDLYVYHETDRAWLVSEDEDDRESAVWLPKSQCDWRGGDCPGWAQIDVPEWLAEQKDLI